LALTGVPVEYGCPLGRAAAGCDLRCNFAGHYQPEQRLIHQIGDNSTIRAQLGYLDFSFYNNAALVRRGINETDRRSVE
jgi:hypothetical protein